VFNTNSVVIGIGAIIERPLGVIDYTGMPGSILVSYQLMDRSLFADQVMDADMGCWILQPVQYARQECTGKMINDTYWPSSPPA
jgi:hypothetical protein